MQMSCRGKGLRRPACAMNNNHNKNKRTRNKDQRMRKRVQGYNDTRNYEITRFTA